MDPEPTILQNRLPDLRPATPLQSRAEPSRCKRPELAPRCASCANCSEVVVLEEGGGGGAIGIWERKDQVIDRRAPPGHATRGKGRGQSSCAACSLSGLLPRLLGGFVTGAACRHFTTYTPSHPPPPPPPPLSGSFPDPRHPLPPGTRESHLTCPSITSKWCWNHGPTLAALDRVPTHT